MSTGRQGRFETIFRWTAVPVVLIVLGWTYWLGANRPVSVYIPPPRHISPNAYRYYRSSMRGVRVEERMLLDWAINREQRQRPAPCPPGISAPPGAPPVPLRKPVLLPDVAYYDEYELATLAEKQALLRPYLTRLAHARKGFAYRCLVPQSRSGNADLDTIEALGFMCHLLLLDGQVKELRCDWDGALDSYMDSLRVGADLARGGGVEHQWGSADIQRAAAKSLWPVLPRVSAQAARSAANRLAAIAGSLPSQADVLREQKYSEQARVQRWVQRPDWRRELARTFRCCEDGLDHHVDQARCFTVSKAWMLETTSDAYDEMIRSAHKPYHQDKRPAISSLTFDNYCLYCSSMLDRAIWEYARAMDELLSVTLALHAWRLENGSYPASLSELVPEYLKWLPRDPFALKGTFRYRAKGSRYLLYSLGPDSVDNSGTWISGRIKGDIVAGLTDSPAPLPRSLAQPPKRPLPHKIREWQAYPQYGGPPMPMPWPPPSD